MFKSWLISNIEFLFIFLYLILAIIFQNQIAYETPAWAKVICLLVFGFFVYGILASLADAGILGSILVGIMGLAVIVLAMTYVLGGLSGKLEASATVNGVGVAIYFILSFVLSIIAAVFGFRNFDDVVDRRWLFRNSNVSIYEEEWKYALNRFAVTLAGFSGAATMVYIALGM